MGGLLRGELHHPFCSQTKSAFLVKKFICYLEDYHILNISILFATGNKTPGGGNIPHKQG